MLRLILAVVLLTIFYSVCTTPVTILNKKYPGVRTVVDAKNTSERSSSISLKILNKPHHLFIGRCKADDEILHGENIILNNDGKSQVSGTIRINVDGPVYITCVKILDQVPDGKGAYPSYVGGGVGFNYVLFNVTADYGKGFDFYVQVNGYTLDKETAT